MDEPSEENTHLSAQPVIGFRVPQADALLARVRSRWRHRTSARALLHAVTAAAATAAVLVLLDYAVALPGPLRALLRPLPGLCAIAVVLHAVLRIWRAPDTVRLALFAEERAPALAGYFTTALTCAGSGVVGEEFRRRAARVIETVARQASFFPSLRRDALVCAGAVLVLVLLATAAGGRQLWRRWIHLDRAPLAAVVPGLPLARATLDARDAAFADVRVRVTPPRYTGLPARDARAAQPIQAFAGSAIELQGTLSSDVERVEIAIIGGDPAEAAPRVSLDGRRWHVTWRAAANQRGVDLQAIGAAGAVLGRRVLPAQISADREPRVQLDNPAEDLVLARAAGSVRFQVSGEDDFGIADLRLQWILSRGSGESFTFTEGEWPLPLEDTDEGPRGARATREIELATLGLAPGDVLHVRALARDANDVTGPGTGVSATRLLRIAREDEMADVSTLIGFPLEAEREPVLSQRMIILLTERLIENTATMDAAARLAESERIAREQARLREHVADVIFAGERGGADVHDHDAFEARAAPVTAADSARRVRGLLEAASRATGQGTLAELGHQHDPDPALAVNRPLLAAFNSMYDAERALRLGEPRTALPHEYRALEVLQQIRAAERVFLRGRQAVAPVDIAAARGTGKRDDAEPAPRSPASPANSPAAHADAIGRLIPRLHDLPVREAALQLSALAATVLSDPTADPRAGATLTRAAEAVAQGHPDDARSLALQARAMLSPGSAVAPAPVLRSAVDPTDAAYLTRIAASRTPARSSAAATSERPRPFVFATVRYESGDWDSGQLVPANLIHSMALYTDVAVAPEGVIVDLSSADIFRYPLLYMTGHLPVRFSAAEAANLKTFVERGGLVFIDDHNHDIDGAFHRTAVAELRRIFGDESLQELPNDHELYRAFFSFPDGPPTTSHELNGWGDGLIHEHLLAVTYGGRIGVLYSNKDYTSEWSYHVQNKRFQAVDNTRFGVNVIIYALTR